jgi:hypothetical protein
MRIVWNLLAGLALFAFGAVLGSVGMLTYRHCSDELVRVYRHHFDELGAACRSGASTTAKGPLLSRSEWRSLLVCHAKEGRERA